jgi:hypothetical protein
MAHHSDFLSDDDPIIKFIEESDDDDVEIVPPDSWRGRHVQAGEKHTGLALNSFRSRRIGTYLATKLFYLEDHFGAVRRICCGIISCLGGAPQTLCQLILYAYSLSPVVLILCLPNFEACLVGSEEDVQEISAAEWRTQVPNQVVHIGEFGTSLHSFCV